MIDAGGCFGDTALVFASTIGPKGQVHTFDLLKKHCMIMRDAFAMNPPLAPRIAIHEVGLADEDSEGSAASARDELIDPGARVAQGGDLPTRTIDSLVADGAIDRIDYIKMDIEGSELAALRGGKSGASKVAAEARDFALSPSGRLLFDSSVARWAGVRIPILSGPLQHSSRRNGAVRAGSRMKAVILAGGMGTRISEESYLRPKPMIDGTVWNPFALNHLGEAYRTTGFLDDALVCFERSLKAKPDRFQAYNNVGILYQARGTSGPQSWLTRRRLRSIPATPRRTSTAGMSYSR